MAHARHAHPHVGNDVDDGAAVRLHPLRVALARHQETAGKIGTDDGFPALLIDVFERRCELSAGVVDEMINATEATEHSTDRLSDAGLLADVARKSGGIASRCRDLGCNGVELGLLAADERHFRAQRCQFVSSAAADAAAAAGHDRHAAVKQAGAKYGTIARGRCGFCHVERFAILRLPQF